jgi:hypothetical protein
MEGSNPGAMYRTYPVLLGRRRAAPATAAAVNLV